MPSSVPAEPGSAAGGYVAVPATGSGPWPGVVVIHEFTGLNADIRAHTDRLAEAGYLSVAPDLYGGRGVLRCLRATFRALSSGVGGPVEGILGVRDQLRADPRCTGRVGILGFCVGGGFALLMATRGFDVAAPNYGPLPKDPATALAGACPIVASYGRRDRLFGRVPEQLESVLTDLDVDHDVRGYPDAGHSFMNRRRTGPLEPVLRVAGIGYDEAAAEHAWGRILAFFDQHLQGA